MGTDLKKDQFIFFYETYKVVYDSVLKEQLLNSDPKIMDSIIPKLVAFRSLLCIRNIQL